MVLSTALISLCLTGCNAGWGLNESPTVITVEKREVIIPEPIPEDLLAVPDCPEVDEITWGDARRASDQYRRCKDLRGQRIEDIGVTVRGRWDWLREQAVLVREDDQTVKDAAKDE